MLFTKIVPADLQGKGVIGQPAVPGLSVTEMQESVEQIVREVAIPAVNRLVDELGATTAAGNIGAVVPDGLSAEPTVQDVVSAIHEAANSGKDEVAGDLEQHKSNTSNPHAVTAAQTGAYTKEETEAAIDAKVVQIGAGDMARAIYDPAGEKRDVFAAIREAVALDPKDVGGMSTYVCATSGSTHALTGTGNNIKFVADAAFAAGDSITVNGQAVTAQTQAGEALSDGAWASGATVVCWLDGVKLTVGAGVGSNAKSGFLTGQWIFALGRLGYGGANVNDSAQDWVNYDDDLSKTVYAALYAVVGDNLSVGAASGMFNCKKMADRFPVISGSSYAALSQGGEATHTLTIDEMPSHTHLEQYENPGSAYYTYVTGTTGNRDPNSVATNVPTLPAGGGAAHNNMPPYVGMYVHIHA